MSCAIRAFSHACHEVAVHRAAPGPLLCSRANSPRAHAMKLSAALVLVSAALAAPVFAQSTPPPVNVPPPPGMNDPGVKATAPAAAPAPATAPAQSSTSLLPRKPSPIR